MPVLQAQSRLPCWRMRRQASDLRRPEESVMSRLFGPVFQMAYVVPELEPYIDHLAATLGIGPFFLFPMPLEFEWMTRHDQPSDRTDILTNAAIAFSGDTMIEVIVPGPDPSPYAEFLAAGRSGLHHLGT
ncbi:MAG: hypothetical protein EOP58_06180, partial [Sphingomonadales bacterium]